MPGLLIIKGLKPKFPSACFVCLQPADKEYTVSRTFGSGNRASVIEIPMPLCADHFAVAISKNPAEKLVEKAGIFLGILAALGTFFFLLSYWSKSEQGSLVLNILLAAFIGLGAFLITWVSLAFFGAPLFADKNTKAIREAVKIKGFWPNSQELQLEFKNERVAEFIARRCENQTPGNN